MKTPPLLLGATIIFWGWNAGLILYAIPIALLVEGSRIVKWRWQFSQSDFNRFADLCTILFIGIVAYLYLADRTAYAILIILKSLPLVFVPILIPHIYSSQATFKISSLFLIMRKQKQKPPLTEDIEINLTYPYFVVCILSASIANVKNNWFYAGMILLCAWSLWPIRSKRFSPAAWLSLILFAGLMGYSGQLGIHSLQRIVEKKALEWFMDAMGGEADPYRASTAIGDIVKINPSNRILFRVAPNAGCTRILLREASYNIYKASTWFASRSAFAIVQPETNATTW
ncbi:MAG: transglutaminase domain-containing protein, partial [Pseudomonadota bacterium]